MNLKHPLLSNDEQEDIIGGMVDKPHRKVWVWKAPVKMLRITAPHFVAGIEVGAVCAPIIKYMHGWSEEKIREYCRAKGWKVEEV